MAEEVQAEAEQVEVEPEPIRSRLPRRPGGGARAGEEPVAGETPRGPLRQLLGPKADAGARADRRGRDRG